MPLDCSTPDDAAMRKPDRYRVLFDCADDAIYISCCMTGRILDANPAACACLGYTRDELVAMSLDQLDTPEEAKSIPSRVAMLQRNGRLDFETMHRRKDGTAILVEVHARLITWGDQPALMGL